MSGEISPKDAAAVNFKCPKHKKALMRETSQDMFDEQPVEYYICYDCEAEERAKKLEADK